jgi:hypothetical protein
VGPWHGLQVALRHLHGAAMETGTSSSGQFGFALEV